MRVIGSGELLAGDRVQLTDERGKMHSFFLTPGQTWHSHKGWIRHDEIIGQSEGVVVKSSNGTPYQVFRPLLNDYVLSMERGATIIYPKDSAAIVGFADIAPGTKVLEAGAGSGALSISLLRAIGSHGQLVSYEEREDFIEIARRNVRDYFGDLPTNWELKKGPVQTCDLTSHFDRIVLDMLAPWECLEMVTRALKPGGVLCLYVATTTQLSKSAEAIKELKRFSEPESFELMLRSWHHEGLAVRPQHSMNAHTGFLLFTRLMSTEFASIPRRRRPQSSNPR